MPRSTSVASPSDLQALEREANEVETYEELGALIAAFPYAQEIMTGARVTARTATASAGDSAAMARAVSRGPRAGARKYVEIVKRRAGLRGRANPFKSKAQRRKFYAMAERGEIPWSVVDEWESATGDRQLPERAKGKKMGRRRRNSWDRRTRFGREEDHRRELTLAEGERLMDHALRAPLPRGWAWENIGPREFEAWGPDITARVVQVDQIPGERRLGWAVLLQDVMPRSTAPSGAPYAVRYFALEDIAEAAKHFYKLVGRRAKKNSRRRNRTGYTRPELRWLFVRSMKRSGDLDAALRFADELRARGEDEHYLDHVFRTSRAPEAWQGRMTQPEGSTRLNHHMAVGSRVAVRGTDLTGTVVRSLAGDDYVVDFDEGPQETVEGRRLQRLSRRRKNGLLANRAEISAMRALWDYGGDAFERELSGHLDALQGLVRRGLVSKKATDTYSRTGRPGRYGNYSYGITRKGLKAMKRAHMDLPGLIE